jgi:hypothetical protein
MRIAVAILTTTGRAVSRMFPHRSDNLSDGGSLRLRDATGKVDKARLQQLLRTQGESAAFAVRM